MGFTITATDEKGAVSIQRDTSVGAHEKATELTQQGFRDVLITDPAGQVYPPVEFERLFLQDRS